MPRVRTLRALPLGLTLVVVGCADLPTSPEVTADEPELGLIGDLAGGLPGGRSGEVNVLRRTVPLTQYEVASEVIGPWGGTLHLPEAKARPTVVAPLGALDRATRITVTAPAGDLVGYHSAPHGLQFDRDLTVTQNLLKTQGFRVEHFSGYVIATNRA